MAIRKSSSIVWRLIVYFLLLNVFTVIVISSYSYFRAKDALVNRTFEQLISIRIEKKKRIERFFIDRIEELEMLAQSEQVKGLAKFLSGGGEGSVSFQTSGIIDHIFPGDYYKRIFISTDKVAVYSLNNPLSDSISWRYDSIKNLPIEKLWTEIKELQATVLKDYQLDQETDLPIIFLGAPLFSEAGNIIGMVSVEIDIEAINAIMYENNPHNGLGKSGESYLVGDDFLLRSTSRFENNSVFKTAVQTLGAEQALNGNTDTQIIKDYREVSVLSSFSPVDILNLHWAILVEMDQKEAMVPIVSIRNNLLYLSILISLLLFAMVYLIATRISSPIIKLKQAAENISKGKYEVLVEEAVSRDEIGSLVKAFNEMATQIKEQTNNLELERSMRLSSMIDGQELERHRLSRELHDGLGQSILAIKMRLERTANASPERVQEIMSEVQGLFANVIAEVRSISNGLMPAALNEFGLLDALSHLCREVSESSGMRVEFVHDGYEGPVEGRIKTYLYRIAQEALNNAVKHSGSVNAKVELKTDSEYVFIDVSDLGRGFTYDSERKICGNGISNMKERVHLLNGEIDIHSQEGKGTMIEIRIPLVL